MSTNADGSGQTLDEINRQIKQAEMIRQYLQVTNIDTASSPRPSSASEPEPRPAPSERPLPLNLHELRRDLKSAEERVLRLRQEVKDLQNKRTDTKLRAPPPYIPPAMNHSNTDFLQPVSPTASQRDTLDKPMSPLIQEFLSSKRQKQQQASLINQRFSRPAILPNDNPPERSISISADLTKDQRQRQFLLTMYQHRKQLMIYLDSLKQALSSLDQLASLEPTRNEVHLAHVKLDAIQQKSRQLRALKSNRSPQQSPFIQCRIRQLERDLVYMLSEHQTDVQAKLELNEQRSLMLLKIMQVSDELASLDHRIEQLLSQATANADTHRLNSSSSSSSSSSFSSSSNELHQQQTLAMINPPNNLDGRHVSFLEPADTNPMTKLTNAYYHYH